jgi:hypothetical protein
MTYSTHRSDEKLMQIFGQKLEWKSLLGRPGHRSKDNIKFVLKKIVCEDAWIQWHIFFVHGNEPSGSIKGCEFCD